MGVLQDNNDSKLKGQEVGATLKETKKYVRRHRQVLDYGQKRPNTFARVRLVLPDGEAYEALGFSKVMHPDEWDSLRGRLMAIGKATAEIARDLVADGWDS